ncbi:hypothetical protein DFP72DRAFT_595015 [Ephemerocybe angulata]|uniref:Uncharacterized protein n=1 Tax=Ephemerocybe angulata TaxID=980116 RepID=A0A8H6IAS5_9AGAR|nr:hypothetical protein DFP72DRAFT_595015 [Tulosesus angulatus]
MTSASPEDPTRPARHSPTLVRSFNPNDPDVRERQRTMDVDMAMQLSRARRETNASLPFETHPPSSLHHQLQERSRSPERDVFPAMLDEEDEMHYDHEGAGRLDLSGMDMTSGGDRDTVVPRRTRSDPSLHHAPTHPTSHTLDPYRPVFLTLWPSNVPGQHVEIKL